MSNRIKQTIRTLTLIVLLIISAKQSFVSKAQSISINAGVNTLFYDDRYYPDLFGPKSPYYPTATLKLRWKDTSDSPFAKMLNHPEYGVAFNIDAIGMVDALNGPGVGNIYSVYGYYDRQIARLNRLSLEYTMGFGLGLIFNKMFDPITNPWNEMVSYPLNGHLALGLQTKYLLSDRYYTGLGVYFKHNSNGSINYPNCGYNGLEFSLLVGMNNPDMASKRANKRSYSDDFTKSYVFDIQATGGFVSVLDVFRHTEATTGIGQNVRRFKYGFNADCLYKYTPVHATGIGLDLFVTPFCDLVAENDGSGKQYDPISIGISMTHEVMYNNLSAMINMGKYLYDNDGLVSHRKWYQLVQIRYYLPGLFNTYSGIILKAHGFCSAESIQVCIGKRF